MATTPTPSPSASDGVRQDGGSLVHSEFPLSSYPAYRGKQVALTLIVIVLVVTLFLPWWRSEIPLDRVADWLNAWQLLWLGAGMGNLAAATGYSVIGNILFGLVPVVPVLLLIVQIILRVANFAMIPANALFLWSLLSALGAGWMFLFGFLRLDAANGAFPVVAGPWIVLVVTIALCTLCAVWWSSEQVHFPKRRWLGFGPEAPEVREELDPAALFADIEQDDSAEDVPIDTSTIDISEVVERTRRRQAVLSDDETDEQQRDDR